MYVRSARILLAYTFLAAFLRFDLDFSLMYTRSDSLAFRQHVSLSCCVSIQISVLCTHVLLDFCLQTHITLFSCVLTQSSVSCMDVVLDFGFPDTFC